MNLANRPWALLIGGVLATGAAHADTPTEPLGPGLHELGDAELAGMRGRYTLGGNAVAWFGVTLVSQWQTAGGTELSAAMQLGFDLRGKQPQLSFAPRVQVVDGDGSDALAATGSRQVDSQGLANVDGLVQSVQLAGDGNRVGNSAQVVVRSGAIPGWASGNGLGGSGQVGSGAATAQAWADGQRAGVRLQLTGHGQVEQWLGNGQLGQSVALTTDGSWVSNQLQLDVVRAGAGTATPLAQNVAQAIGSSRGLGIGGP